MPNPDLEDKQDEGERDWEEKDENVEWESWTYSNIADIMTKLISKQNIAQAWVAAQPEILALMRGRSAEEVPFAVDSLATCSGRVARDLDRCIPLAQIQSVLQTLEEESKDGSSLHLAFAIKETRDLRERALRQLIVEGADTVTDTWVRQQPTYVQSAFSHSKQLESEAKSKAAAVAAVPQISLEPNFTREEIERVQQSTIRDKAEAFFGADIPNLLQKGTMDTLLLWILRVSQKTVNLNDQRFLSAADQRFWQTLTDKLRAKIPIQFQQLAGRDPKDSPINLLQNMISNIDQNNVEEAVEVMKKNMTNMMKEGVWVVAAYTTEKDIY